MYFVEIAHYTVNLDYLIMTEDLRKRRAHDGQLPSKIDVRVVMVSGRVIELPPGPDAELIRAHVAHLLAPVPPPAPMPVAETGERPPRAAPGSGAVRGRVKRRGHG